MADVFSSGGILGQGLLGSIGRMVEGQKPGPMDGLLPQLLSAIEGQKNAKPQDITGANAGQLRQAIFDTNGPDGMQKLVDTLKPYGIDLSSLMQGIPGIAK
jgi:hypothetical protein